MAKREKARSTAKRAKRAQRVTEVSASEAKNAWHEILDRVSESREEVVITRYGKPIARLAPVEPPAEERRSIFGWMAGTVTIHGDIIEPLDVEWNAMHE